MHLMIYFPPWNCLLALCPLASWNYTLTNFIYAIVFKLFCVLKEKFLFYWGFSPLAPKQNFLTSAWDPFQYSLSSGTRQMPGCAVLLFHLLLPFLLGISTSCWSSLIHFSTLLIFFYSLLFACVYDTWLYLVYMQDKVFMWSSKSSLGYQSSLCPVLR